MNRLTICLLTLAIGATTVLSVSADDKKQTIDVSSMKAKVSYGIGMNIGTSLKSQDIGIDPKIVVQGLLDAFSGSKPLVSRAALTLAMQEFQREMAKKQKKMAKKQKKMGEKAKVEGGKYLAANKKKKGVITTKSGLQYEVIKKGTGPTPKKTDKVKTHYHGTLINGTVFDSSVERNQPISFDVTGVIAGWTEALQLMKVGGKWKLTIPSELAYGKRGSPPKIAPDSVLVFEIELLGIE